MEKFGGDIAQTDYLKNRQLVDLYSDWLYFLWHGIIELMYISVNSKLIKLVLKWTDTVSVAEWKLENCLVN